jgi:hypothetical protein
MWKIGRRAKKRGCIGSLETGATLTVIGVALFLALGCCRSIPTPEDAPKAEPVASRLFDRTECDYDVTTCTMQLRVLQNSPDVWVNLDVTYDIHDGKKSDGFRNIWNFEVADFTCTDGAGNPLLTSIDHTYGKNNLVWFFPEKTSGLQRVIARFRLPNLLKQENGHSVLDVAWAGVWRIPVQYFSVDVLFPKGVNPEVVSISPDVYEYELQKRDGAWVVHQEQTPLGARPYRLEFITDAVEKQATDK